METSTAPPIAAEGLAVDGKYRIGACLVEGDGHATYETSWQDRPAVIKLLSPETAETARALLAGFAAGQRLRHANLLEVYGFGEVAIGQTPCVYVVVEGADENLAGVLRDRALDSGETRQILAGIIPALEFLHVSGYVHGRVRPAEVFACGNMVKLSADCIRPFTAGSPALEPSGLYDAPEVASGVWAEKGDSWSVAVLALECLTRSPYRSEIDRLSAPFRRMVEGGLERDVAERWTLSRMRDVLEGRVQETAFPAARSESVSVQPKYRRFAGIAVGGALVATALVALLVRSAHQAPQAVPVTVQAPAPVANTQPAPVEQQSRVAAIPAGWAVVCAAYNTSADAEKRATDLRAQHPKLNPKVFSGKTAGGTANDRFFVVSGAGLSEVAAKRQLARTRKAGAPHDAYVTRFR